MADSESLPMRAGAPSGTPGGYNDPADIDKLLRQTAPGYIKKAGKDYQTFASAHGKFAGDMVTVRDILHEAWGGEDAAAAQSALREIWASSAALDQAANEFGTALKNHGQNLDWYQKRSYASPSKNLAEARSWMAGANERIAQAWTAMPSEVSTTLPPGGSHGGYSPDAGAGPTGGGPGGDPAGGPGAGGASGSGGHVPGFGGGGTGSSGHVPGGGGQLPGTGGSNTNLAGWTPTPSSPGIGGSGGGAGPLLNDPGIPGVGGGSPTSGLGGAMPPGGVGSINPLTSRWGAGGAAAAATQEAQAAEASAASRAGMMGPAVGAGADRGERERERATWLVEDEDVWNDGIEAGPQLIGDGATKNDSSSESDASAEDVQLDLSSDSDDLAELLKELDLEDSGEDPQEEIARLRAKIERLEQEASLDQSGTGTSTQEPRWPFEEDA
ncbi:hypothetical protein GCM10029978_103850 [Actinoallomurus acanthiterrae]